MNETRLILQDVSIGYRSHLLVEHIDAVFPAGTLTALTGRNGTGKSTLLRVIAGLARPLSGRVLIDTSFTSDTAPEPSSVRGEKSPATAPRPLAELLLTDIPSLPPRRLAELIGFVSTERIRVTNLNVYDLVALGRTPYTDWMGKLTPHDRAVTDEALRLTGMDSFAGKAVDTLSDGEAQRAMIARVVAQDTPVILLDEPTAFLDFHARREMCELLAHLAHERGKTIVFSSHELDLVAEFADRRMEISPMGAITTDCR